MIPASFTDTIQCPFAVKWAIPEEALRQAANTKDRVETNAIAASNIPGVHFWLYFEPNRGDDEKAWMFFSIDIGNEKQVEVFHIMDFEAADRRIIKTLTFVQTLAGGSLVCSTNDLFNPEKMYIVDGILNVEISGIISVDKLDRNNNIRVTPSSNPTENFGKVLWAREHDKDSAFVVGKKEIKVHQCILGAHSSVFDQMFQESKNGGGNRDGKIVVRDFPYRIVEAGIMLCYHKGLATVPSMADALLLLQFFDRYDVRELKAALEELLVKQISTANVCQLATYSVGTNCPGLKKGCIEFMVDCISKKIPVLHVELLDGEFAKELINESLFTVFK